MVCSRPRPARSASAASIRPLTAGDRPAVRALDQRATGANRTGLLDALEPLSRGWVAEIDGIVRGTLLCRAFGRGQLLGPLVASDESLALALLSSAATETGGFLRADIPDEAAALARWLEQAGLPPVGRVRTMRTRGEPPADAEARDLRPGIAGLGLTAVDDLEAIHDVPVPVAGSHHPGRAEIGAIDHAAVAIGVGIDDRPVARDQIRRELAGRGADAEAMAAEARRHEEARQGVDARRSPGSYRASCRRGRPSSGRS